MSNSRRIKIGKWSLYLSIWPSFIYPLFRVDGEKWIKEYGCHKGEVFWLDDEYLVYSSEEALYWSGAWFNKSEILNRLHGKYREIADRFLKMYGHVGLSISRCDDHLVFIAIFLSRRTSWEINTIRWCKAIFSVTDDPFKLAELKPFNVARSYQLKQLHTAYEAYLERIYGRSFKPEALRKELMKIPYVGPKTADAYLLFTGSDVSAVPIDVHLVKMIKRLNLAKNFTLPNKSKCITYGCNSCPIADRCIKNILSMKFGKLAGWIQTVIYIHDNLYCSKHKCQFCTLNKYCGSLP